VGSGVWVGQNPETLTMKQQAKDVFNLTILDNIIQHFYLTRNQKHFTRQSLMARKLLLNLLHFYAHGQLRGSGPPSQ